MAEAKRKESVLVVVIAYSRRLWSLDEMPRWGGIFHSHDLPDQKKSFITIEKKNEHF